MALPSVVVPKFDLTVPSDGRTVSYRPFTMKEEKVLLVALEGTKPSELIQAVHTIVETCTDGKIDTASSPMFDVQYAFLQIRTKSVGEIADFSVVCGECQHRKPMSLDLSKIDVERNPEHTTKIVLSDEMTVEMQYPTIRHLDLISSEEKADTYKMIAECIKTISTKDEVFIVQDEPLVEILSFIDSLTLAQFAKIQQFFATMPVLRHDLNFVCEKCSVENKLALEGIESFFV